VGGDVSVNLGNGDTLILMGVQASSITNSDIYLGSTGPVDTTPPSIAVSSDRSSLTTGQTATLTFTVSEIVLDFIASDITVSGGVLSAFAGSGTSYAATFTPTSNSTANGVVSVASNKFSDTAGNFNVDGADANNTVTITVNTIAPDTTPPTIAISSDKTSLKAGETTGIVFTLSEPSANFVSSDVAVSGGTLTDFFGNGTSYFATFTPTANSSANGVVTVASGKFSDAAGNFNLDGADANNTVTLSVNTLQGDTTPPTIAIRSDSTTLTAAQSATLTFTLSEPATDFVVGDISVSGGSLSAFTGSATSYTARFTPNGSGNGVVSVSNGKFSDAAGNFNVDGADANNSVTITVKPNTAPVATTSSFNLLEDTAKSGTLSGTDVDGDVLSFAKLTDPAHGTLSLNSTGAFTYTPVANYFGTDSFSFKVNDGNLDSASAAVSLTISNVNDPPTGMVTISPGPKVSEYASVSNTLVDVDGIIGTIRYQWRINGQNIPGETGSMYFIGDGAGSQLSVLASYTDGGGVLESVLSQVVLIGSTPGSAN
jgi:VCBS repeat-containing protein